MKLSYANINGIRYPMCLSVYAIKEIDEKICPIDKLQARFSRKQVNGTMIRDVTILTSILIKNGCEYCNIFAIEPSKESPIVNGKYVAITYDQLLYSLGEDDLQGLLGAISECLKGSQKKQMQTKAAGSSKKKNYKGTSTSTSRRDRG